MTTATLPGFVPDVSLDYWSGIPVKAMAPEGIANGATRVFRHLLERTRDGADCVDTNEQIAAATGLSPGSVNRILNRLKTECPPGVGHPYIHIGRGPAGRQITVRYRGKPPKSPPGPRQEPMQAWRAQARATHASSARASARPSGPKTPENKGSAARAPSKCNSGERSNVDVVSIPGERPPHAPACERREGPTPVRPEPPAPPPVLTPVLAPEVAAAMPSADGVDRELAAMTDEQLGARIADLEARRQAFRAGGRIAAANALIGPIAAARDLLAARQGPQEPAETPKVESLGPRPAAAPAATPAAPAPHVETPDLIRRLKSPGGAAMAALVVARLCEKLDPEFEPLYRRCCEDVLAGRLDVGAMIGGFRWARNAPGFGKKKGPSFAAYIGQYRETRQRRAPPQHRRE